MADDCSVFATNRRNLSKIEADKWHSENNLRRGQSIEPEHLHASVWSASRSGKLPVNGLEGTAAIAVASSSLSWSLSNPEDEAEGIGGTVVPINPRLK